MSCDNIKDRVLCNRIGLVFVHLTELRRARECRDDRSQKKYSAKPSFTSNAVRKSREIIMESRKTTAIHFCRHVCTLTSAASINPCIEFYFIFFMPFPPSRLLILTPTTVTGSNRFQNVAIASDNVALRSRNWCDKCPLIGFSELSTGRTWWILRFLVQRQRRQVTGDPEPRSREKVTAQARARYQPLCKYRMCTNGGGRWNG